MARMQSVLGVILIAAVSLAAGCAHHRVAGNGAAKSCDSGACAVHGSPENISRTISTSEGQAWDALDNDHTMNAPTGAGSRYRQQETYGTAPAASGGSGSRSAPVGGGSGSR
ncbi:MAG: hypothetical protein JNL58_27790 [Planctomyces sp.]|nr:hypothetical protein [Planctomyces sp.]